MHLNLNIVRSLRPGCCRPALFEPWSISALRYSFVANTVYQMESSHPAVVAEMHGFVEVNYPIGADGKVRSNQAPIKILEIYNPGKSK